ncbi:hypothetical protein BJ508DRAFT_320251 [Ascobolus immersus RN42]|uniref:Uncharacterized protein n=1 Tax=Ascobolus immersus RN42 TaxID=1160509 RepID=A0A3N4IQD8_ASCIM|nr:hypothetical protein BJ508DRAFT_320251 [Ascobolus immersus RN42]
MDANQKANPPPAAEEQNNVPLPPAQNIPQQPPLTLAHAGSQFADTNGHGLQYTDFDLSPAYQPPCARSTVPIQHNGNNDNKGPPQA